MCIYIYTHTHIYIHIYINIYIYVDRLKRDDETVVVSSNLYVRVLTFVCFTEGVCVRHSVFLACILWV